MASLPWIQARPRQEEPSFLTECVQISPGLATTYLLADSAFLLAGHQYVSHLSKLKLKFKGGGTYTMSVTRGHKIIHILPTASNQETPHRVIYLLDEPYDPPTYVNNVLFQCSNRPNVLTPSAFTWHLRYACKSLSVLQHTQQHVEGLHVRQVVGEISCCIFLSIVCRPRGHQIPRPYVRMCSRSLHSIWSGVFDRSSCFSRDRNRVWEGRVFQVL